MSWGKKDWAHTDLDISFWFSVVVLTCCQLASSSLVCVRCETLFRADPKIGVRNFCLPLLVFSFHFYPLRTRLLTLSNPSRPLSFAWCRRKDISVSSASTPAQKVWNLQFFQAMTEWPTTSALIRFFIWFFF